MADYYPLLARAVAALPNSSRETRAAIYERARKALIGQLKSIDPPVTQEHLDRESKALDDAVARLEAELAQEAAKEPAAPAPAAPPPSPPRPAGVASPPPIARPAPPPVAPARPAPPPLRAATPPAPPPRPATGATPVPPPPAKPVGGAAPVPPKPVAPELPGQAPAPVRPAPETPATKESALPDRAEKSEAFEPARDRELADGETPAVTPRAPAGAARGDSARPGAPSRAESGRRVSRQMLIWVPLILLIGGGIGFAAWRLRVPPEEFAKPRPSQSEARQPQGSAKINERAGAPGSSPPPAQQAAPQPARPTQPAPVQQAPQQQAAQQRPAVEQDAAPVAQRAAILVQAAVNDQQNIDTHVGTTVWRLEESRRPNANGMPALRADVDIAPVGLRMVFLIEKNNDPTLRASHMLTFRFLPQEGSPLPAIAEIGSPQMRNETAPAVDPLAGAQAKITDNIFIVALNADPALASRNLETMKARGWFDFPIRLADGRIAKITIEKGSPGERLLSQAIDQWQR